VAEHALGMMLSLSKLIPVADRLVRRAANLDRMGLNGRDIKGKTLGLVGIGEIGTRMAELCRGLFGMTVLACDPSLTAEQVAARGGEGRSANLVVSVTCRATLGMLTPKIRPPTAYFIRPARRHP
jgi:D-3-phosphoglycerate dehydrogenase